MASPRIHVREMQLDEVGIRIDYFHGASDDHLRLLGVDRALLPTREAWRKFYEDDYARSIHERVNYSLIWDLDGELVGFSSSDQIQFGEHAFTSCICTSSTRPADTPDWGRGSSRRRRVGVIRRRACVRRWR